MLISTKIANITPSATLAISAKAKAMIADGIDVINFGVGEPDFDTPENIRKAGIKAIKNGMTRYTPASGTKELKAAIADKLKRENGLEYSPKEIVVSSGAKHTLYNLMQVMTNPGDEVLLPAPYWVSYYEQIGLAGGRAIVIECSEKNKFKMTPDALEAAITPRTKYLIFNSPSNPTGAVYTRDELQELAKVLARHEVWVIADEIYEKLIYNKAQHVSLASLSDRMKKLTLVVNGVSKTFAMTGWRIGYAAGDERVIAACGSLQSHSTSNPCSISMAASVEALQGGLDAVTQMRNEFDKRRKYMLGRLSGIKGVACIEPGGAFYAFPNIKGVKGRTFGGVTADTSVALCEALLEQAHVAAVPGSAFGADDHIRFSYATSMENIQEGMNRFEKFLS